MLGLYNAFDNFLLPVKYITRKVDINQYDTRLFIVNTLGHAIFYKGMWIPSQNDAKFFV